MQEIERFINEAEHGVIYVNLGTTVKDSTLAGDKLNELLSTFGKLPLRVLWKWDGGNLQLPRNVMTMKWFPQYDILSKYTHMCFIMGHCLRFSSSGGIWNHHWQSCSAQLPTNENRPPAFCVMIPGVIFIIKAFYHAFAACTTCVVLCGVIQKFIKLKQN